MIKAAAMMIASAGGGVAAGATGMYLYLSRRRNEGAEESAMKTDTASASSTRAPPAETEIASISSPRSLPLPADDASGYSPVASDFIMPFVKRYGYPDLDQVILPSEEYTSCWDSRTRNARWVVERINLNTVSGPGDRKKSPFRADSRLLPLFRSDLSDFYSSGYDRGHLAPAGDHKTTQRKLTQTFLLSNMAPQTPSFNRGYWSDFEEFVRSLVVPPGGSVKGAVALNRSTPSWLAPPFKDVYVVTGPLFLPSKEPTAPAGPGGVAVDASEGGVAESESSPAGSSAAAKWVVKHDIIGTPMQMVAVPTHFFKVIIAEPYPPPPSEALGSAPTTFVAAFAMPNTKIPNNTDLRNFLVPLEALEGVAGMRFLGATVGETGAGNNTGLLDEDAKLSLDQEALQVRTRAGVPQLPGDWGSGAEKRKGNSAKGKTLSLPGTGAEISASADNRTKRLFRHLCTATSCRGL